VAAADLRPPALIIVGEVVGLRDRLGWFEARPLLGRRIVVTRSRAQASDVSRRLESLGAEVIEAPAIRIEPPDDVGPLRAAVRSLSRFNWVVLTSTNGVDALFQTLAAEGMDARALAPCKVASIGASTTQCLAARGIRADLEPETFTGASLAEAMIARGGMKGANVLLARADIAPKDLPDALAQAGAVVHEVVAYRTVRDMPSAAEINAMLARGELDWLTFTSSSTVRYFVEGVPADTVRASRARIASIGPTTSATLRDLGLEPTIEADPHTIPGLVDALLAAETRGKT
jgi:uroporphyrinogen III methyltransferase/synthase